jgi:hypothetical protein
MERPKNISPEDFWVSVSGDACHTQAEDDAVVLAATVIRLRERIAELEKAYRESQERIHDLDIECHRKDARIADLERENAALSNPNHDDYATLLAHTRAMLAGLEPYQRACRKIQQWIGCEDQEVDEAVVARVEGDARKIAKLERLAHWAQFACMACNTVNEHGAEFCVACGSAKMFPKVRVANEQLVRKLAALEAKLSTLIGDVSDVVDELSDAGVPPGSAAYLAMLGLRIALDAARGKEAGDGA